MAINLSRVDSCALIFLKFEMATRRGGRSADHEAEHSRDRVTTDDELDIDADGDGSQLDVDVEEEEAQLLAQPSIGPVASATNKADSSTATSAIVETRYSRPSTLCFAVGLVILATILGFFAAGHLETLDLAAIRDGIIVNETVVSSPADERKFQWFTLGSGIEILVVSDTAATRAAAAVDVHVGSWADPVEFPGLAHFLEHMLFLGTEKYPQENEYNSFLSAHGGGSNAYTDSEVGSRRRLCVTSLPKGARADVEGGTRIPFLKRHQRRAQCLRYTISPLPLTRLPFHYVSNYMCSTPTTTSTCPPTRWRGPWTASRNSSLRLCSTRPPRSGR